MIEITRSSSSTRHGRDRAVGAREQLGVRRRLEGGVLADVVDRDDLLEVRAARRIESRRLEELRVRDQDLGARVTEDRLDLGTGETGVDRDEDGVGERHAEVSHELLGEVREEVRDAVAGRDPGRAERAAEPLGFLGELGIGQSPVAVDDRDSLAETRPPSARGRGAA